MRVGHTVNAVTTGKPVEMGGSLGRREATGRGVMFSARSRRSRTSDGREGRDGGGAGLRQRRLDGAQLLAREGCKVVAISDRTGGWHNPKGIDVDDAIAYVKKHRRSRATARATASQRAAAELDVDVLVPAALENVITTKNAKNVKAKIICEGANGPTTASADAILDEKGIFVIPDILANAGGVTVSTSSGCRTAVATTGRRTVNERLRTSW
jgi:glutamate dehydrogenase (NAD(P)+)